MNTRFLLPVISLALLSVILISCAGSSNPIDPITTARIAQQPGTNRSHALWGMWQVSIDKTTRDVEILPLRGVMFNANVTQFLHPPFSPVNMMIIDLLDTSDFPNGYVEVDVTLNHPFPGINQYSGFDVRGIFMADGSKTSMHDTDIIYGNPDGNEAYMLNEDGMTRWWNSTEFTDPMPLLSFKPGKMGNDLHPTATLNPYKYYADDLGYEMDVADMPTSNRGVFTPGGLTHKRLYKIQFPVNGGSPQFVFNYAIDASWDEPNQDFAPDFPIEAFGPGAQVQEAYNLSVNTDESMLWYEAGDSGGNLHLEIEVFDWQGVLSSVADEVGAIWVESPILMSPVDILPGATALPGSQATSSVFETELTGPDLNISSFGVFPILICVESADPTTYQPQLDGGEMFVYPDGPLAAYKFGSVQVLDTMPYEPALDVTGNLKLSVIRNTIKTMTGIQLDWSENTNPSPYYAIYADENPYNGIDPDVFVAEVTTDIVIVDSTLWPSLSTSGGYVFGVKGRTVSGLPASESPNLSEVGFVEMEDWDGGDNPGEWVIGYRNSAYKWEIQTNGLIDGSTSIRHNAYCEPFQWSAYASPVVPTIPDSAHSIIEFAHLASNFGTEAYYKAYMAGYTKDGNPPPTNFDTWYALDDHDEWNVIDGTFDYDHTGGGYWTALAFFKAPSDPNPMGWRFYGGPHNTAQITRISLPEFISQANNTRAAVAWGRSQYWLYQVEWLEMDEIAVVVY